MKKSTPKYGFSSHMSLAALGVILQEKKVLAPLMENVIIPQKTIKFTPNQKLYDALIALLAGAHGIVEINTLLRSDPVLQNAFGRSGCAEQSVVQETLSTANDQSLTQMKKACCEIFRTHSLAFRHNYNTSLQILDVDMTGNPCGKKAEFACKGYFENKRNRRGRQIGRVTASLYNEIIVDQLFEGNKQLRQTMLGLVEQTQEILELDEAKRSRTLIRVDSGGGSLEDINNLLQKGYQVLAKDYSGKKAHKLCQSVESWHPDPKIKGREVGFIEEEPLEYIRPVRRIGVRCRKKDGTWSYAVLICTLPAQEACTLVHIPFTQAKINQLLAYTYLYDARGGSIEIIIKDDKQGLSMTKRNKRSFNGQQMLQWLTVLAHNVLIWAKAWLIPNVPKLQNYGILRLVRDVMHISGRMVLKRDKVIIKLNKNAPMATQLAKAFTAELKRTKYVVILGET